MKKEINLLFGTLLELKPNFLSKYGNKEKKWAFFWRETKNEYQIYYPDFNEVHSHPKTRVSERQPLNIVENTFNNDFRTVFVPNKKLAREIKKYFVECYLSTTKSNFITMRKQLLEKLKTL